MRWRGVWLFVGLLVGASPIQALAAAKPYRVAPDKAGGKQRRADRRAKDFSEAGTKRGNLEFGLGSVAAAVTLAVIGRGIWELTQISEIRRQCADGASDLACGGGDEGRGNRIAAGLSFGFAVPLGLATGWLFARALRTRRDHRRWHLEHPDAARLMLRPAASRRGAGLALRLRF